MSVKRYILMTIFTAFLAVSFVSCVKDEIYNPIKGEEGKYVDPTGPYLFSISAGREQTIGDDADTRATLNLNNYNYYWNSNEQVNLTVTNQGTTTILADMKNIPLTKTNSEDIVLHANFWGDITLTQYTALSEGSTFDYYSYYSNGVIVNDSNFPNDITFELGQTYSLTPDTFEYAKTPMVGMVPNREPNILFLENQNVTHADNPIHFDYDHTTSYAAIEFDVRLLPDVKITSLTMTVGNSLTNATRISGTYTYDVAGKTGTLSDGSNSVTIAIPGGLNIGNGEKLYIPMPVKSFINQTFTFTFTTSGGTSGNSYGTNTVSGVKTINFERGEIHPIRVAPPVAKYAEGTSFTVTKAGYYYIEAWGGNGGKGSNSYGERTGGVGADGATIRGLYYLNKDEIIYIQVGAAALNASGRSDNIDGGTAIGPDYGLGNGGAGGSGGAGGNNITGFIGNAGGGGGAASGILRGGSVALVAGGGGGGGGASSGTTALINPSNGGAGGTGGSANSNGNDGMRGNRNNNRDGYPGVGGASSGVNGNVGGTGENTDGPLSAYSGGGGGGGAGGGYTNGGGGGTGGRRGAIFDAAGAGAGGAGGGSYLTGISSNPGYSLPVNSRPSSNGYVVITYFREQ